MNSPFNTDRKASYARAASRAKDRGDLIRFNRRVIGIAASGAFIIACLEALALAALLPLKVIESHTILVDRQTGFVQVLKGDGLDHLTGNEALTQSLLAQYVIARESFDSATIKADYRKVALWSADRARQSYITRIAPSNPDSPFNSYPSGTVVEISVKSVSAIGYQTVLVRFDAVRRESAGGQDVVKSWASVVRYRFNSAPMEFEDRLVNPLGFQVVDYRRDAEAVPRPPIDAEVRVDKRTPKAVSTSEAEPDSETVRPNGKP